MLPNPLGNLTYLYCKYCHTAYDAQFNIFSIKDPISVYSYDLYCHFAIGKSLIKAELPIGAADAPLNIFYLSRTIHEIIPKDTTRATKAVSNLVCMTEQLQPWQARTLGSPKVLANSLV